MNGAEIHTLTGAYALDALTDTERVTFERHLDECAACSQEVRELQETAVRLGIASAAEPPEQLREQVLADIARTRQQRVPGVHRLEARRWPARAAAMLAAAAVAAAAVFGVRMVQKQNELNSAQQHMAAISAVLGAGDATVARGAGASGGSGTAVVSASQHDAVLMFSKLPAVDAQHAYQAWRIGPNGTAHSAGLLRRTSDGRMQPVVTQAGPSARAVAVTVEPAGGSQHPTTSPVMRFQLA